jgi:hypothetical protein|tara:strand:+ start:1114 stop:1716 length:603 start_codon:yes stop_codon:yes gene_type:complete
MYAKVENNQIVKANSNLGAFGLSPETTVAQREAQGVYEIIYDNSNLKDTRYYTNGAESIVFANNAVTASYGTATGKNVDDTLWTQQDSDDGDLPSDKEVGDVKVPGLKTIFKNEVKAQAKSLLSPSDWYVIRKAEDSESTIPSNIATYRAAVRTKSNEMETAIDGAADAAAMETLYTYTNTGTEESPVYTRPLGEWPELS